MDYYSQHGEDIVLWEIFNGKKNGKFVDIGAMDGVWFSNSYSFEKEGWKGLLVEAHPVYYNLAVSNRPNSIVVNAAVANQDMEEVDFYANKWGMLSTLKPDMVEHFKFRFKRYMDSIEVIKVKQLSLNTILENENFGNFDFLSIDIEGEELAVLMGLDLTKYTPRIIVSEAVTKDREEPIKNHLKTFRYEHVFTIANNLFFSNVSSDSTKLKKLRLSKDALSKIIKVKHPLEV